MRSEDVLVASMDSIYPLIKESLENGKSVRLSPKGSSMLPMIRQGIDTVTLSPIDRPLKKYDIPLYLRDDGKYVLHRIVKVHKDSFDMCGDAQREIERNVPKSAVVAQAVGFIRKGRQFSVNSPKYRLYALLWCSIIPLRKLAFRLNYKIRGRKTNEKN